MRRLMMVVAAAAALAPVCMADAAPARRAAAQPGEQRCGWLQNPTPGNYWFTDRDGEWVIRTQGPDEGPRGWDNSPDFTTRGWVATNGSYGYGCACMRVDVDGGRMTVVRFYSGRPVPLAQCRRDRSLREPRG